MTRHDISRLCYMLAFFATIGPFACDRGRFAEGPDVGVQLDAIADTGLDAGPDDGSAPDYDATVYNFCGLDWFKLPVDGTQAETIGITIFGDRVTYSKHELSWEFRRNEVMLFDLTGCAESELTAGAKAVFPWIQGNAVYYSDMRNATDDPDYHGFDLYWFDLDAWQEMRLSDNPLTEMEPHANDLHVLYARSVEMRSGSAQALILWNLVSGEEWELAPSAANPIYYDINERYVVWSAYVQDPASVGKDIFYYDLVSKSTVHLNTTHEQYQYIPRVWDEYVTWDGSDAWEAPPYHQILHHIPTGSEVVVAENDSALINGWIHQGLVVFNTARYRGAPGPAQTPYDLAIYDIDSGVTRRITASSGNLGVKAFRYPWVIAQRRVGPVRFMDDSYLIHLQRLGITDSEGRVIAGEGVLEQPQ